MNGALLKFVKDGIVYKQAYATGTPTSPLEKIGTTEEHGTLVTFKPDATIFPDINFVFDTLAKRFERISLSE